MNAWASVELTHGTRWREQPALAPQEGGNLTQFQSTSSHNPNQLLCTTSDSLEIAQPNSSQQCVLHQPQQEVCSHVKLQASADQGDWAEWKRPRGPGHCLQMQQDNTVWRQLAAHCLARGKKGRQGLGSDPTLLHHEFFHNSCTQFYSCCAHHWPKLPATLSPAHLADQGSHMDNGGPWLP